MGSTISNVIMAVGIGAMLAALFAVWRFTITPLARSALFTSAWGLIVLGKLAEYATASTLKIMVGATALMLLFLAIEAWQTRARGPGQAVVE